MTIEEMKNKIICGDCLEVMKQMPDKCVDLVVTDPPYGIDYQSNVRTIKFDKIVNDDNVMRFKAYDDIYRILKDDSVLITFCSFKNYSDDYKHIEKLFDIKNCIIWFKGGGGIGDLSHSLLTDYEMAIVGHKGKCKIRGKRHGSVWSVGKVNPNTMQHPTEKPHRIVEQMIDSFSDIYSLIFDPFAGSGTTLVAAKHLKRNYIGIEIEPKYCEIAEQRLRQDIML